MLFSEKRWHFVAVVAPEALVAAAVADLGYLGYGFAYAVDRLTGRHRRFELKTPLGWGAMVAPTPDAGRSQLVGPGSELRLAPAAGQVSIQLMEFSAAFAVRPGAPFAAEWRVPGGGLHRTVKRLGGSATGTLHLNGETRSLEGPVLIDWSRGEPARETAWRWACGAGVCEDGRALAWNLRTGFDDPKGLENAVWVDGRPVPVGPATIVPGERWEVAGGALTLAFSPEGQHAENVDALVVASRYRQPWGAFEGTFEGLAVKGYGVCEDHWARW